MRNVSTLPITLRLLRPNKAAGYDDIVKIYRVDFEDDCYKIIYEDNDAATDSGTVKHESVRYYSGDDLDTYLSSLFTLLTRDADPFESLQIAAPGFPSILLHVGQLKKATVRQEILNVLPLLTNFWKE
jgi:hypothetical protein